MYVARIGSFQDDGNWVFFEGRRFNAFAFSEGDPSIKFMEWLADQPSRAITDQEITNANVRAMLHRTGFLVDTPDDIAEDIATRHNASEDGRANASVHLIVAQYCNLKCSYCYNGEDSYKLAKKTRMSKEIAEQALRLFMRYVDPEKGSLSLNFLGGEPLLGWVVISHVLENMQNWAAEEGFKGQVFPSLQTNLTFLPKGFIASVRRHDIRVLVEIDGPKDIHDTVRGHRARGVSSFDSTQRNCLALKKAGVPFHCKAVMTSDNISKLKDVRQTHFALGGQSSALSELRPVNSDGKHFDSLLLPSLEQLAQALMPANIAECDTPLMQQAKSKAWSNMLRSATSSTIGCHQKHAAIFSVTADGEIYNCPWFVQNEQHFIGNVKDSSVDRTRVIANVRHLSVEPDEACQSCAYFGGCGGGCPVTRELCKDDKQLVDRVRNSRCATYIPAIQSIILARLAQRQAQLDERRV